MKWGPMWLWWEFKTQKLPLDGTLDNGLSPGRRLAIIWANAGVLLIGPLGTNFSEISVEIYTFSLKKMHWILKMSSGKWRPFCFGLIVLSWEIGVRAACDESLLDSPDDVHPGGWGHWVQLIIHGWDWRIKTLGAHLVHDLVCTGGSRVRGIALLISVKLSMVIWTLDTIRITRTLEVSLEVNQSSQGEVRVVESLIDPDWLFVSTVQLFCSGLGSVYDKLTTEKEEELKSPLLLWVRDLLVKPLI